MNIVEYVSGKRKYRVTLVPKAYVVVECFRDDEFVSMKRFEVGDEAEYDSFNLRYTGQIVAIGLKTVTISTALESRRRLKAEDFGWRNWNFDSEEIKRQNAITSLSI